MNRKDFRYYSYTIGEIIFDFKYTSASGGRLYPRLFLPLNLELKKLDKNLIIEQKIPKFIINSVKAELYVENEPEKLSDSIPIFSEATFYRNRTESANLRFEFPVDHNKIDRIEINRSDDIKLKMAIQFQLAVFEPINYAVDTHLTETKYFITNYRTIYEDFNVEIPQSYWLKNVLPNLGVGEFFVIELPKGTDEIREAWEFISRAEHAFRNWDSKSVFANCRELGELLDGKVKAKFGNSSFSYKERWQRRYDNYTHYASLDLHLEKLKANSNNYNSADLKAYKSDAENMILSAKVLTKYAQELLNE